MNKWMIYYSQYRTDNRLQELLGEENYSGAIELLLECKAAANTYRHFTCVAALSNKLQETLETTEEQLGRVLAQVCQGLKFPLIIGIEIRNL